MVTVWLVVAVIAAGIVGPGRPSSGAAEQATSAGAPSTPIVATLPQGTRLTVIGPAVAAGGATWWPVKDPETATIGYVRGESLSSGAVAAAPIGRPSQDALVGVLANTDPQTLDALLLMRPFTAAAPPPGFESPRISPGQTDGQIYAAAVFSLSVDLLGPEHGEIPTSDPGAGTTGRP